MWYFPPEFLWDQLHPSARIALRLRLTGSCELGLPLGFGARCISRFALCCCAVLAAWAATMGCSELAKG